MLYKQFDASVEDLFLEVAQDHYLGNVRLGHLILFLWQVTQELEPFLELEVITEKEASVALNEGKDEVEIVQVQVGTEALVSCLRHSEVDLADPVVTGLDQEMAVLLSDDLREELFHRLVHLSQEVFVGLLLRLLAGQVVDHDEVAHLFEGCQLSGDFLAISAEETLVDVGVLGLDQHGLLGEALRDK